MLHLVFSFSGTSLLTLIGMPSDVIVAFSFSFWWGRKDFLIQFTKFAGKNRIFSFFQLDISGRMTGRIEIAITREINATPLYCVAPSALRLTLASDLVLIYNQYPPRLQGRMCFLDGCLRDCKFYTITILKELRREEDLCILPVLGVSFPTRKG